MPRVDRQDELLGPEGCEEHSENIVKHLLEEEKKRNWIRLIMSIPGVQYPVRRIV